MGSNLPEKRLETAIENAWLDAKLTMSFDEFRDRLEEIVAVLALRSGLAVKLAREQIAAVPFTPQPNKRGKRERRAA
jgi:hypothetical protein